MNRTLSALLAPLALLVAISDPAAVRALPLSSMLGEFVFPNPGTSSNPSFDQEFDAFGSALCKVPVFAGVYGDNSNGLSNFAASMHWFTDPIQSDPRFANGKIIPVLGLPMAAPEDAGNVTAIVNRFNAIAAGQYDSQWTGALDIWKAAGFSQIIVRIGYEMNGHWMPWAIPGGNKVAAWIAAFREISTVMKAYGTKIGLPVTIAWNPATTTWEGVFTDSEYPGDDVVDVMSLDIVSSVAWAKDLTNWDANGNAIGTAPDLTTWAASVNNRHHFWLYPDGTSWNHTGAGGMGWGLAKHFALARAHKKPIALSETSVSVQPSAPPDGISDDPEFPKFLYTQLAHYPYGLNHVIIWSVDQSDIVSNFLPNGRQPFPLAKAAWRAFFGDGHASSISCNLGMTNVVTVNQPNPLVAGVLTITGKETDPKQPVFLDWVTYGTPAPHDGGWAQATVDAAGNFSAQVTIDHPGTQSAMFYYTGSTAVARAWYATPASPPSR